MTLLVTTLCWWPYDGDRFKVLIAESFWRWLFIVRLMTFCNIKDRSPPSQTCHQLISPSSVTNINITSLSESRSFMSEIPASRQKFHDFLVNFWKIQTFRELFLNFRSPPACSSFIILMFYLISIIDNRRLV